MSILKTLTNLQYFEDYFKRHLTGGGHQHCHACGSEDNRLAVDSSVLEARMGMVSPATLLAHRPAVSILLGLFASLIGPDDADY